MKVRAKYSSIAIVIFGLLPSCKVTQEYKRPELSLPSSFDEPSNSVKSAEIPAYREFFKDKELISLLDQVMKKNPDLMIASEELLASEAQLK
ncbi:hypothetical protein, partial [Chitinophaga sp.]|uniref:hypothetical protein n=1 Tax=Chitinophaga sp. TaxID=1869181 RepID=UPI002BA4BFD2|nr:hypothetical protein [Chitinophaga sp.]